MFKANKQIVWDAAGNSVHVGDEVSISTLPLFGRHGVVERIGRSGTTAMVRVNLLDRVVRIRLESLRVYKDARGNLL